MGQSKPLNNFSFSHGVCRDCKTLGRHRNKRAEKSEPVRLFYESILESIGNGIYVEPSRVLSEGKRLNLPVSDLFLGILHPLLVQVGQYFEEGRISVEKEHLFSKAIKEVVASLTLESGDFGNGIVLFPAIENIHTIGLSFLRLLIARESSCPVAVLDQGPATYDEFAKMIEKCRPELIGVSFALPVQIDYLRQIMQWRNEYKGDAKMPPLLAGGQAASEISSFADLSGKVFIADVYDTKSTIAYIARICGNDVFGNGKSESKGQKGQKLVVTNSIQGQDERLRVFVLDDEKDFCDVFSNEFASTHVGVSTFVDPGAAIEAIRANPPDVLFIDYWLPGTTGDEVAKSLAADIPKYLITGYSTVETAYKFKARFNKPYNHGDIQKVLDGFLKSKSSA